MTLLLIVFFVTLTLTAFTYVLVNRTLEGRETAKVRDRLAGRAPAASKPKATPAQPLFVGDGSETPGLVSRVLAWFNVDRQLQKLIEQSGVEWAPGQVVLSSLLLALAGFNLWWYMPPLGFAELAFLAAPVAGSLPVLYLRRKRNKRIAQFEAQFPDALMFIARAMRAGHAFSVSLEMLHKEMPEPLSGEFRIVFEEQNLGLPIDVALEKLSKRMPLLDVQFFVAAVVLQKRTGGNLGEILDKLATLIRERFKLRGKISTISAHGRMSSSVLTAIPAVVAVLLYFVNPAHMAFFVDDDLGRWMAGLAVGFVILGFLIMRQIVKIEV